MREETKRFETQLRAMKRDLEAAGGMPVHDAVAHMHAMKRFLAGCSAAGFEGELLVAMERAGLGDVTEALLPLFR